MKIVFSKNSWEDYISWQKEDKKILKKINELIKNKREVLKASKISTTLFDTAI